MTSKVKNRSNSAKMANDHLIISCDPLFERELKSYFKNYGHVTLKGQMRSNLLYKGSKINYIEFQGGKMDHLWQITYYSNEKWKL